ncbi:MAG TPA: class I SAM-dependent methyltransferase [Fulvivirga sp.]|nr:class I SAM-dependent methyltransferase [Fulvivirga sp.]
MDKGYYKDYYVLERNHWWFMARLKILKSQVESVYGKQRDLKILNVGIATGATTQMLSEFGDVTSVEYDEECCAFVKEELRIDVIHGSITDLPFDSNTFDLVTAFDVIEHVEDDKKGVEEMMRVCNSNGHIFVTVPALMSLWSDHDVINHHFRRYKKKELIDLFKKSGSIIFVSYFNSLLFLPIYLARKISNLFGSKKVESDFSKFKLGLANNIMKQVFLIENGFLKKKINFPIGVSLLLFWKNN